MKTRSKVILCAVILLAALLAVFAANSLHVSLFWQTRLHPYHILWDHTEESYDARFLVVEANGTYTAAVYEKTALGWRRMLSYAGEDCAMTSVALYDKAQKDISNMRSTVFCLIAAEPEPLERMRESAVSTENLQIDCFAQELAGQDGTVQVLFGVSDSPFGSDDLIIAAEDQQTGS